MRCRELRAFLAIVLKPLGSLLERARKSEHYVKSSPPALPSAATHAFISRRAIQAHFGSGQGTRVAQG